MVLLLTGFILQISVHFITRILLPKLLIMLFATRYINTSGTQNALFVFFLLWHSKNADYSSPGSSSRVVMDQC